MEHVIFVSSDVCRSLQAGAMMHFTPVNTKIMTVLRNMVHFFSDWTCVCVCVCVCVYVFFLLWRCDPTRVMASSFLRFLDYTQRRSTVGRTPPDEWSAGRRDLYLTTHNTHNRQHIHAPSGIRTHDLSRRAAANLRLRLRGHWNFLKIHINIIFLSTPHSSKWSLSLRFPQQSPVYIPSLPQTFYMPRPSHSSRFDHPNNIWWGVQRWWTDYCNYSVNPLRALCVCVMNRNRLLVSSRTNGFPSLVPLLQETSVDHLDL